jgi:D-alanyl-lipoteichoic acid acyltransferase DltB (MBOAT superfamily)
MRPEPNLLNFATFVAFFPQLVAGPIERARDLLPQFNHYRPVTWKKLDTGLHLIASGLFKKVVVADTCARVADSAFELQDPTGWQSLIGVYAFAFQIYGDFSGYSDIARGTARCLGFELCRNFNLPYFSTNPSEFWQRWHISLSAWLRDYLYISLGGNRQGTAKTYRNLMLTMLLGGLWHGAAWTFVAWGAFHGALLCAYRALEKPFLRLVGKPGVVSRVVGMFVFFQLTAVGWLLFRAESLPRAWAMFSSLWRTSFAHPLKQLAKLDAFPIASLWVLLLVAVQLAPYLRNDAWLFWRLPSPVRGLVYATGLVIFILAGVGGGAEFIYFQF